jgi:hypothetical protein
MSKKYRKFQQQAQHIAQEYAEYAAQFANGATQFVDEPAAKSKIGAAKTFVRENWRELLAITAVVALTNDIDTIADAIDAGDI